MKHFSFLILSAIVAFCGCSHESSVIEVAQVEPLVKILPEDSIFTDMPDTIEVARGENAAFQFVVTAKSEVLSLAAEIVDNSLGAVKTGWVHDIHNENPTHGADDMIVSPSNNYPDPIIDDATENLEPGLHKTLWVDVTVPKDAKACVHELKLEVRGMCEGKNIKSSKKFYVKVYPVTLPDRQGLTVVNWYTPSTLSFLNKGEKVEQYSDRYYELLPLIAKAGAEYGQNCWLLQERPQLVLNSDSTDFDMDFSTFDKGVELFKKYGNARVFCNSHLGGRRENSEWSDEHCFSVTYVKDKKLVTESVGYRDKRLKAYIDRYYSELENHLKKMGWLDIFYQHIADEPDNPGTNSQKSWSAVAAMVKAAAPDVRTIDASKEIIENQDVSVICLDSNIVTLPPVKEGTQRWMYTCTVPQGNYANRFVQLPLIKTRILHWMNFKYNEEGYLHWGFNYWSIAKDPMKDLTSDKDWPGGDCFIIYPGYEKIYPSIRLCAMREGIRDYDLLKMVEAIDANKARKFCDSIILGADRYNLDIRHFYQVRHEILEFLSNR